MVRAAIRILLALCAAAGSAAAQGATDCSFSSLSGGPTTGIGDVVVLHGAFEVRCSDGVVVRADSGTINRATRETVLVGNVYFEDAVRTLTSQQAVYSAAIKRLYATGNVVFTDRVEGTTLRGPELEYFAVAEGRPQAQVNAGQRPHLTLQPRPRAGSTQRPKGEPLEIDSDRLTIVGSNDLSAYGDVVIRRTDLTARAAEAEFRGVTETLELRGGATIDTEEYDLAGEVIHAELPEGSLRDVQARGGSRMTGTDLQVTAPELQLFFERDTLQRAVARTGEGADSTARALASSKTFRLLADSIDASLPGQRLREVVAVGRACGESVDTTRADSAFVCRPAAGGPARGARELIVGDWMVGDTITGYFAARVDSATAPADTAAATDTAVTLTRLVARGNAQSLYRVEPEEPRQGTAERSLSFLSAAAIDLAFEAGAVQRADVKGMRRGLYLEPTPASTTPAPAAGEGGGAQPPTPAAPPGAGAPATPRSEPAR